ncbi:Lrp/AsnC family transcriptional regulator [Thermogymnomonas acidicola]|uniref:AsnC family protein n=1 Tax=Thermogymnomonas acidicola TaxID=399579 RepID=UPI00094618BE|nr:AsnC family protein [Thermogymnomonas acidicola]
MDLLDYRIVTELIRDPTAPYEVIGSRVGLSGGLREEKVLGMFRSGFIRGLHLLPSPPLNFHMYRGGHLYSGGVSRNLPGG